MKIQWKGLKQFDRNMKTALGLFREGAEKGVLDTARKTLRDSNAIVPYKTGALKLSSNVSKGIKREGSLSFAEVWYHKEYALYQHEGEGFNYSWPYAQPKYLEKPTFENKDALVKEIKKEAPRAVRSRQYKLVK